MGCCSSTPDPSSSAPTTSPSSPAQQPSHPVVTQQPSPIAAPTTNTLRPNVPIRPPSPLPTSPTHLPHIPPPWTRAQLSREREAFFDTRVSGNAEIWKALRVVCEEVRSGRIEEAQAILDAVGVSCPTGRIAAKGRRGRSGGLWDERGVLYEIPAWVVCDPEDLIEGEEGEKDDEGAGESEVEDDREELDEGAVARRRDEKGKGRAEDVGDVVVVRARLSDRGTDIGVSIGTKQRIGELVRRIRGKIGDKRVRIMYLGKILDERSTLEASGWVKGHVLNAMVFEGEEGILSKKT